MKPERSCWTGHALVRSQQRGIPPLIDELLERYGVEHYDGHGAIVLYLHRKSLRLMERDLGREPVRRLAEWHRAYKVKSSVDGTTITLGKRYRPVRRP